MASAIQTFGSFILVLGILVFVHEFGHFLVAKLLRIGVPVFSLGFGPRILGFRKKETDYRVSLVPLGGYVRLAGDESDESRTGVPEEFLSRPKWQRFLVFVAGAAFNIVLALVLTWATLWTYGESIRGSDPVVRYVRTGSHAEEAGILQGDKVLSIADRDASEASIELEEILMSPETVKTIVLEREGQKLSVEMNTGIDEKRGIGDPGWELLRSSSGPIYIGHVEQGEPADEVGIEAGDLVLGADGQEPIGEVALRGLLASSPGKDVTLKIRRGEEVFDVIVRPQLHDGRGRIGVNLYTIAPRRELSMVEAIDASIRVNLEWSSMLFLTLKKFAQLDISVRAFSGPVEIARYSRMAILSGWEGFLTFLAFISLQLGILNLMPIPVLDGGHIMILAVESTIRRELSDRLKERVMQAGLVLLLAFMGFVIYFDVIKAWF